nr:immunoglobulin light chain junction region [Macaca mulatta]MOV62162.1 immunoglobulin light chain junction region [Macaca mulatta]MOV63790.1 immunoglobulin light chain junction region [Macaca mulatta]
CQQESNWSLSF